MDYNSGENLNEISLLQTLNDTDIYQIFGATESIGYVQKVRGSGSKIGTIKSIRDLATGITTYNNDILFDNLNYDGEPETHAPTYDEFNDQRIEAGSQFYYSTYKYEGGILVGCPLNFNIYGSYTDNKCVKMGDIEIQSLDYFAAFNVFNKCTTSTYAGTIEWIEILFLEQNPLISSDSVARLEVISGLKATTGNANKSFSNISSYADVDYVIYNKIEDNDTGHKIVKLGTPFYVQITAGTTGGGGWSNLRRCYIGNSSNPKEYTLSRISDGDSKVYFQTIFPIVFKSWKDNTISFEWGA